MSDGRGAASVSGGENAGRLGNKLRNNDEVLAEKDEAVADSSAKTLKDSENLIKSPNEHSLVN
jgi:hypothetical protein